MKKNYATHNRVWFVLHGITVVIMKRINNYYIKQDVEDVVIIRNVKCLIELRDDLAYDGLFR